MRKPIIGLSSNYWGADEVGLTTKLGLPEQDWDMLACDYSRSIEEAGGIPVILPVIKELQTLREFLKKIDGFVFTGGQDISPEFYNERPARELGKVEPVRDSYELAVARELIYNTYMPVLGICRGIQLINVACGGSLYQDIPSEKPDALYHSVHQYPKHHPTHKVNIIEGSKLYEIFGSKCIMVNSFHHQAVKKPAEGFIVTATAEDGLIEAIECTGERFILAVQWHPEMMYERHGEQLEVFKRFVREAAGFRQKTATD